MQRLATRTTLALAVATLATGCAIQAPPYNPSLANVDRWKVAAPKPVAVGAFTVQAGATGGTSISLRGNPMGSPVGSSYADYLAQALRQELQLAGRLGTGSSLELSGLLLSNDIAAGGFSTNSGVIEARFVVKVEGTVRYDQTLKATDTWDSSFVGAVAIPKAQQQYPVLVQKLLTQLLADPAFASALR